VNNFHGSRQLIVGTYTESLAHVDGKADGILAAQLNGATLGATTTLAEVRNPSWVTLSADGRNLYSVIETVEFDGIKGGGAAAYARDPETGALTLLNTAPSQGVEPAHLELDPSGKFLLVSNYRTGSVTVFRLEADGSLGADVDHVQHEGSSSHPIRQTGPHAHQEVFDPITGDVLVPDLGLDQVIIYAFDSETGHITERSRISLDAGAGPRHLAFHPNGNVLFLICELDNTVLTFSRSADGFSLADTVSSLPADFDGHNQTAAIRVSTSGRWVFGSNRGHDSIAVFAFDESAVGLKLVGTESTHGKEPRDFIQVEGGLLVANQDTDSVAFLAFDDASGELRFVESFAVPTPVCLVATPE
jgi:6-phosphogluconolactonase